MELTTSEFFMNLETLPPDGTQEFFDLLDWEREKCLGGVNINGVKIPGWLYWHLNHWWITVDGKDSHGNKIRKPSHPDLRDNEWIISEAIDRALNHPDGYKGVMIAGARQIGKSEAEASYTIYNATLFKDSQNIIVGGNDADLTLLKAKIDFGIDKLWEGIRIPKLDNNWRQPMVKLGFKSTDNKDQIWSYIMIRNVASGKNTEGPAGVTAKSYIGDEIAKYPFADSFEAAKPAFMGEDGWRCVPLLVCTGGNAEKFADAERYFLNPEAQNFLGFTDPNTGLKTALFMSGEYRSDCKYLTNLGTYLKETGAVNKEVDVTELNKLPIKVADKQKARDLIMEERRLKAKDPDQSTYLKQVMYFPLTPEECFLSSSHNYYNAEIAKKQKDMLIEKEFKGMWYDLSLEGDKVIYKESHKRPISSYPTKPSENLDAPVVIVEHPMPNPPYAMYVAGVDPYKFAQAANSDSLGAVYIFKRLNDVQGESYQDMPVAWYVANPKTKEEWNEQARLLIKYYNARALCENDEYSFIDYMIAKGDGHLMEDTPEWLREYIPTSSTLARPKGISRSSKAVRELLRSNLKQYMEEPFISITKTDDAKPLKILGVNKIMDAIFLTEIEKWNEDGNFDREVAMSIAVTCARKYDSRRVTVSSIDSDPRFTPYKPSKISLFPSPMRGTSRRRNKLF